MVKLRTRKTLFYLLVVGVFFLPMPGSVMTWGNKKFKGKRENKVENASLWGRETEATIYYNPRKLYSLYQKWLYIQVKRTRNNRPVNCSLWCREAEANSFCKIFFVLCIKTDSFHIEGVRICKLPGFETYQRTREAKQIHSPICTALIHRD